MCQDQASLVIEPYISDKRLKNAMELSLTTHGLRAQDDFIQRIYRLFISGNLSAIDAPGSGAQT